MKVAVLPAALLVLFAAISAPALTPLPPPYFNDFQKTDVGKAPAELMVLAGTFAVKEEDGNKFLELPGAPLDTFGLLFGPTEKTGIAATARFFGTKQGRKFPTFGVSLNGVGGYRLQVSPAKKALEIYKGDEPRSSVPFEWQSGEWVTLRIRVRKAADGCIVEGMAWRAGEATPEKWSITLEENAEPPPGRAGIWGSPYAGTPIRFDDLAVSKAD